MERGSTAGLGTARDFDQMAQAVLGSQIRHLPRLGVSEAPRRLLVAA
jgi:hypothetical protein